MVDNILGSLAPRIVQDLILALATYLTTHGFLTAGEQTQGFIGSAFFLAMLVINGALHINRQVASYNKGASDAAISSSKGS